MNRTSIRFAALVPAALMTTVLFAGRADSEGNSGGGPGGGPGGVAGTCSTVTQTVDSPGAQQAVCPCFVPDEIVMTIHDVPATPAGWGSILKGCQIQWGNALGVPATTTERAIIIYIMNQTGPVNPATFVPVVSFPDPQLAAQALNQFTFSGTPIGLPGNRIGVALKFRNATTGTPLFQLTASTIVNDTNGHNNGPNTIRNWIFTDAGTWISSQSAGVSGDWVIRAIIESCPPGGTPDLNHDGVVDGIDLAMLLGSWGPCGVPLDCPSDLNLDGIVNGVDLAMLLAAWGPVG